MGTSICHTTNILSYCFAYIVQWIKPPFRIFPFLISHRHMKYLSILSRQIVFSWIDIIIAFQFLFVNTIFIFFIHKFITCVLIYNYLTFSIYIDN